MRLFGFELKKLIGKRGIFIALILFSMINLLKIHSVYQSYSYLAPENTVSASSEFMDWHTAYWTLYPDVKGTMTNESIERILALYRPLEEKLADLTASTEMNQPGTITGNDYSDANLLSKYYMKPMEYFYTYRQNAEAVIERARENVLFYREHGNEYEARKNALIHNIYAGRVISNFEYTEMVNYLVHYDFSTVLTLLLVLYGIVGVFVRERETQMTGLLITSPKGGRETALAKLLAASVFAVCVSLWFSLSDVLGFALTFGTWEGLGMPVYAITNLSTSAVNMTLLQYIFLSAFTKALGIWVLGMMILLVSRFWDNALVPFIAGGIGAGGLAVLSSIFAYSGNIIAKILNPATLLTNRVLFGKTEIINMFGFPVLSYAAAIGVGLLIGGILVAVIHFSTMRNRALRKGRALCLLLK
ncbi:MAG: ABC transporter permease [Oscillospiraceae bacterium]|jgi:hypothetical protein|nr:ABC transporter permease [Oscillospiraceae bacterium]